MEVAEHHIPVAVVCFVCGLLPMVLYATFLWWIDAFEREPVKWLITAFLWGFFPASIIAIAAHPIVATAIGHVSLAAGFDFSSDVIASVLATPVVEETAKAIGLMLLLVIASREWNSLVDGIVYGATCGFGFSAIENLVYFLRYANQSAEVLWNVVVWRALHFGPIHALFSGVVGLTLALSLFSKGCAAKRSWPNFGLLLATTLHAIHNSLVLKNDGVFHAVAITWILVVGALLLIIAGNRMLSKESTAGSVGQADA